MGTSKVQAGCCYGNPVQYERNRRFRHLVHVPGRSANGARLPSGGATIHCGLPHGEAAMALSIRRFSSHAAIVLRRPWMVWLVVRGQSVDHNHVHQMLMVLRGGQYDIQLWNECAGTKSSVDDLILCRGDLGTRAAITLRGVESYPYLRL
ncbi:cytoplasmic antigen 1 [Echinococcus multilocularis]|uniref:Cytoplasmic antigen 1 n=1 Tax=Echinococcus multilocularis TaxID=6211 RepID=U6HK62_ECHMU|nr:cytoplasmic antigen 1 [Echinococcus multilocularis]CDS36278.1 cytoplasmic antigen 1 [Echinococcus multilocularis]CUT99753.1 cytoplasmic antigen 1 [Echinococcus multilocularis]